MPCLVNSTSTTSKRSLWPEETRGLWVVAAWESRLKLSNNITYDDWGSALGAMTLGYAAYDEFIQEGLFWNPSTSLPWQIEHDFAEEFCAAMNTEAVRFAKNGSDATNMAVRLARGVTGRDAVVVFDKSYHGTGDWFGQALWTKKGIINDDGCLIIQPFGEQISFPIIDPFATYEAGIIYSPSDVAAIMVEPVPKAIDLPPAGWLQHLREVCDEHGIVLIADQVILGYRHALQGYPGDGSVRFDLSCYGKAMGQGSAISACTGRMDIMQQLVNDVHYSGTNFGSPLELQIAQWTLREYLEKGVCETLNVKGHDLKYWIEREGFDVKGLHSRFEVLFTSPEAKMDCTRFCFEHGILWPGFASMAVSHTVEQMEKLVDTLKKWRDKCSLCGNV